MALTVAMLKRLKIVYFSLTSAVVMILVIYLILYVASKLDTGDQQLSRSRKEITGYILATHFSDQLTGSCSNLLSLQCWAGSFSAQVGVVEPFLHLGSIWGFDIGSRRDWNPEQEPENTVRLSHLYDIDQWQRFGMIKHYAPLVSWETFLQHAPKQLILLDKSCHGNPTQCMNCQNGYYQSNMFASSAVMFAKEYNFTLVRKSCYEWPKVYSERDFLKLAYGPFKAEESVLLINHYGGIKVDGDEFRVRLNLQRCTKKFVPMQLSDEFSSQISDYQRKFLSYGETSGYISVMIRLQQLALKRNISLAFNDNEQLEMVEICLNNILEQVAELKSEYQLSSVFVATDTGKYGSDIFRNQHFTNGRFDSIINKFITQLLGEKLTQQDLSERTEAVLPVLVSGYVAQFERSLAANGRCLVLVGGGDFQKSALNLYKSISNENCVVTDVPGC